MRIHLLASETWLPRPLDEGFAFHADAANLQANTPPVLDFPSSPPRHGR